MRLAGGDLGRTALRRLCAEGIDSPQGIADAPFIRLARVVQSRETARRLKDAGFRIPEKEQEAKIAIKGETERAQAKASRAINPKSAVKEREIHEPESGIAAKSETILEIDLQSPGLVRIGGREIALAPLGWELLAALADSPGKVLTRDALCARLWPEADDAPQPQQLDAHRRRLERKIGEARKKAGAQEGEWIQVVRGIGLRLNLAEREIALRRG